MPSNDFDPLANAVADFNERRIKLLEMKVSHLLKQVGVDESEIDIEFQKQENDKKQARKTEFKAAFRACASGVVIGSILGSAIGYAIYDWFIKDPRVSDGPEFVGLLFLGTVVGGFLGFAGGEIVRKGFRWH